MEKKSLKRNIIQVSAYYPPHLGGMENCVKEISENLAQKGHMINVLTSDRGLTKKNKKQSQRSLKNLRVSYLKSTEFAHTPIIFSLFTQLLRAPRSSIIHLHISQALTPEIVFLVSRLKKIPYIAHIHLDVDRSGPFGFLLNPYKQILLKPVLQNASRIICLSPLQKKQITQKYNIPDNKIIVLPNGVGQSFFVKRGNEIKKIPTILFVGRLVKQKNLSRLVNAVSLMKTAAKIQIAGDGEDREKIINLVRRLRLTNIDLLGIKTGEELVDLYKEADIFLLTSNKEGVPLVILEAMAAGLPIVAPDIQGVRELLDDTAILIKEPTVKAYAAALDKLIGDRQVRLDISKKVQLKAREYSWDQLVNKLELIYGEAIGK